RSRRPRCEGRDRPVPGRQLCVRHPGVAAEAARRQGHGTAAADRRLIIFLSLPRVTGEACEWRSEAERIGDAGPAAAFHLGEERGIRALPDVGAEIDLGAVEDVVVALDGFQAL